MVSLVGDSLLEPFWPTGTGCARGFFGGLDACWLMRGVAQGESLKWNFEIEMFQLLLLTDCPSLIILRRRHWP